MMRYAMEAILLRWWSSKEVDGDCGNLHMMRYFYGEFRYSVLKTQKSRVKSSWAWWWAVTSKNKIEIVT